MKNAILFLIFGLSNKLVLAQNATTLVRAGYDDPTVVRIAPGQVVTLFATGFMTVVTGGVQRAATVPLPKTLAGISASLQQQTSSFPLPLFSVEQFNRCSDPNPAPACLVTAVTVQIPFDIVVPNPIADLITSSPTTYLTISENGNVSKSFVVSPASDQIHVLNSCDVNGQTRETGVCYSLVTHADGNLVLQAPRGPNGQPLTNSEAKPGETLVMYLYGMGAVSPTAIAGNVPPSPPPTVASPVSARYDYAANASPSKPIAAPIGALPLAPPPFAGLAPKQIGLYQVNFVVPTPPAGTQPCGATITSNLTVSLATNDYGTGYSFDGAAICVDPSSATGSAR